MDHDTATEQQPATHPTIKPSSTDQAGLDVSRRQLVMATAAATLIASIVATAVSGAVALTADSGHHGRHEHHHATAFGPQEGRAGWQPDAHQGNNPGVAPNFGGPAQRETPQQQAPAQGRVGQMPPDGAPMPSR